MKTQSSQYYTKLDIAEKLVVLKILGIRNRIRKLDFNYTELKAGGTGTGKTMTAIFEAMMIAPDRFNENCYCTMPKEFIDAVQDSKTGDVIVWDEAGVGISARQWYSLSNILTGQTLQTFRERNLAVFFCTPDISFIDIQARKLTDSFSVIKRYNNHEAFQWTYKINIDRKTGKVYYPYASLLLGDKRIAMRRVRIPRAVYSSKYLNHDLIKKIREKASEFKQKVLDKNYLEAEQFEKERFGKEKTVFDIANEISPKIDQYKTEIGRIDWHLIGADYNLSRDKAKAVVSLVKRSDKE